MRAATEAMTVDSPPGMMRAWHAASSWGERTAMGWRMWEEGRSLRWGQRGSAVIVIKASRWTLWA